MNRELKQKWVAALRSGDYKQGYGSLRRKEQDECRHCCLGVLYDIIEPNGWKKTGIFYSVTDEYGTKTASLPRTIASKTGLNARFRDNDSYETMLISFNDSDRMLFKEIANWIEKYVPEED